MVVFPGNRVASGWPGPFHRPTPERPAQIDGVRRVGINVGIDRRICAGTVEIHRVGGIYCVLEGVEMAFNRVVAGKVIHTKPGGIACALVIGEEVSHRIRGIGAGGIAGGNQVGLL